jgi:hypothetical protein
MLKKAVQQSRSENLPTPYPHLRGVAEAALYCAHRTMHRFTVRVLRARRVPGRFPAPFFSILPLHLELGVVQPGIHPFVPDQRLMRPIFDDTPVIHNNDAIDAMDSREAMGNNDRRPSFCQIV